MKNPNRRTFKGLCALADMAANGCHKYQVALGLMHNTETLVRNERATAITANDLYQGAKSVRLAATAAQGTADANGTAFLTTARDTLKTTLGTSYSQAWNNFGFINNSLALPSTMGERLTMLNVAGAYLATHPALEVPALLVTHQQAQTLHDALATAMSSLNAAWSNQRNLKSGRDTAENALRDRLGNLFNELSQFMAGDDPRWLEFGFDVPEDGEMPDVPEDLTVTPAASGHLLATWTPGLRSARFHVFKQVVNVDPDFVFVETVIDPTADLNTFTPGQHVKVQVTAVNDAGETQPTEPVEAVVT